MQSALVFPLVLAPVAEAVAKPAPVAREGAFLTSFAEAGLVDRADSDMSGGSTGVPSSVLQRLDLASVATPFAETDPKAADLAGAAMVLPTLALPLADAQGGPTPVVLKPSPDALSVEAPGNGIALVGLDRLAPQSADQRSGANPDKGTQPAEAQFGAEATVLPASPQVTPAVAERRAEDQEAIASASPAANHLAEDGVHGAAPGEDRASVRLAPLTRQPIPAGMQPASSGGGAMTGLPGVSKALTEAERGLPSYGNPLPIDPGNTGEGPFAGQVRMNPPKASGVPLPEVAAMIESARGSDSQLPSEDRVGDIPMTPAVSEGLPTRSQVPAPIPQLTAALPDQTDHAAMTVDVPGPDDPSFPDLVTMSEARPATPAGFWERLFAAAVPVETTASGVAPPTETRLATPPRSDVLPVPPTPNSATAVLSATLAAGKTDVDTAVSHLIATPSIADAEGEDAPLGFPVAGQTMAAPAGPVQAQHVGHSQLPVQQAVTQITAALSQSADGSTEIALSPDELGHVRLRLERDPRNADRIVIHLNFERPDTLDLFRRHAEELADAMRSAGYANADIDFDWQGGSGTSEQDAEPSGTPTDTPYAPDRTELLATQGPLKLVGASLYLRV